MVVDNRLNISLSHKTEFAEPIKENMWRYNTLSCVNGFSGIKTTPSTKEISKEGNILRQPFWGHIWSRVIVSPDYFVAKPAKKA